MSYGPRMMNESDDMLFRISVHTPSHPAERKHYKIKPGGGPYDFERDENGHVIVERIESIMTEDHKHYYGPYTDLRVARQQLSKHVKDHARRNHKYPVHINLEGCIPEWKVVE